MTSGDDPEANLAVTLGMIREAAVGGAGFVLTPEVTNCLSNSRKHQHDVLRMQEDDPTLAGLQAEARALGVWVSVGSLALLTGDADGRFANRSFLISPEGEVAAWYDKIHMFDVDVSPEETYRESDGYRPGTRAVTCDTPFGVIGMTVCYDIRFPALHRALAQAGAQILLVPAAFSYVTGAAHWEPLLRARAIETGCYVMACAQTGVHPDRSGTSRKTHGHSMVVSPWGEVVLDAGTAPGLSFIDFDVQEVSKARGRIASLRHDRPFEGP
jgi:predicted amidohydrolase